MGNGGVLAASVGWPVRIGLWMGAVERQSLRRLIVRSRQLRR